MDTLNSLKAFNRIYKEMDIVYHNYAKACGLSDMAYWILYSIADSDRYFTQREFCKEWFFSPQTVNSALKDLEKRNIIYLEAVSDNKKSKLIKPTENGEGFIDKFIRPLIKTECASLGELAENECNQMLYTMQKYISVLKEKIHILETEISKQ